VMARLTESRCTQPLHWTADAVQSARPVARVGAGAHGQGLRHRHHPLGRPRRRIPHRQGINHLRANQSPSCFDGRARS
jgi:hypothetical protein